jgi:hypothetical protein
LAKARDDIPLPPHAYVPGQTPRHPEDWFDQIKASVTDKIPTLYLHETDAFQAGLFYLGQGYFWECHEVLEAVWMATPSPSPERAFVQAVIQLANARLKLKMGKPRATLRLCNIVQEHLSRCAPHDVILGQVVQDYVDQTETVLRQCGGAL